MTIFDLRCDRCGCGITGPSRPFETGSNRGIRFMYHPGDPAFADNSSLVCVPCWKDMSAWLGTEGRISQCSVCAIAVESSLHVHAGEYEWRVCVAHAVELLNALRTVDPKLDPATFVLPSPPAVE